MYNYDTMEEMFKSLNEMVLDYPDFVTETRIGKAHEILNIGVHCFNTSDYVFSDKRINRIGYDYASTFWDFIVSGGTDAQEAFKEYPGIAKFITKPKSDLLPANFNTFYGPRIVKQLQSIIDELKRSPESRRASIMILNENDLALLDKDETLEFPCTMAYHFTIRNGTLIMSSVMRSQNVAIVLQLDIYLQIRLLHLIASELGISIENTEYSCHMINAHVFERDFEYVRAFLKD